MSSGCVAVIGAGYVGLVTAVGLSELGHDVTCIEVNESRLRRLRRGECPILEPRLPGLLQTNIARGRLQFSGDLEDAVCQATFSFVAVPTPAQANGRADTSAVDSVVHSIARAAQPGSIAVIKSTVPVGTGDRAAELLSKDRPDTPIPVVSNPEFLREGKAVDDFLKPFRIVIGADDSVAGQAVAGLFQPINAPVIYCSRSTAELSKYASNAYLATRVSFIKEIAGVAQRLDADIASVTEIMGADPRIGRDYLQAGLGWGGSCLPKDVSALIQTARDAGAEARMLEAARQNNEQQVEDLVSRLDYCLNGLGGKTVTVLGLAFKPGTDDVRDSQSLKLAGKLRSLRASVRCHDPVANGPAQSAMPDLAYFDRIDEAVSGSDAVIIATAWPEYGALDWSRIASSMQGRVLFDARNSLDPTMVRSAGLTYMSFGRKG